MGLGKTIQTIAFVRSILHERPMKDHRSCLVICPLSTTDNWEREMELWCPELNCVRFVGNVKSRTVALEVLFLPSFYFFFPFLLFFPMYFCLSFFLLLFFPFLLFSVFIYSSYSSVVTPRALRLWMKRTDISSMSCFRITRTKPPPCPGRKRPRASAGVRGEQGAVALCCILGGSPEVS